MTTMAMEIEVEVVESRSDDETCSCSASASLAPSEAEEEVREGFDDDHRDPSADNDSAFGRLKVMSKGRMPDSIPEEPSLSAEETQFSAGTQETVETDGTEGSLQMDSGKSAKMKKEVDICEDKNSPATKDAPSMGDNLVHVPSDEAVFVDPVTKVDDSTDHLGKKAVKVDSAVSVTSPNTNEGTLPLAPLEAANAEPVIGPKPQQEKRPSAADVPRQQWEECLSTLKANPSLMTSHILKLTLHNRPPLPVVQFMLRLNPNAAGVPNSGPSALQVAVRHHASIQVIEEIIRACPYALFSGNGAHPDPLTYARIWRREEGDLIEMLERPISFWINASPSPTSSISSSPRLRNATKQSKGVRFVDPIQGPRKSGRGTAHEASDIPPPPPIVLSPSRLNNDEKRELSNIKLITAAIVKAQKQQLSEAESSKREMDVKMKALAKGEAKARTEMCRFVDERMKKSAKAHLVAIDMKERAFENRIAKVGKEISDMLNESTVRQEQVDRERQERDEEVRCTVESAVATMKEEILAAADRVEKATASYGSRLAELAVRVDKEAVVNAAFRNDMRQRQGDIEDEMKGSLASRGGRNITTDPTEVETCFEVESLPATSSTDHLFGEGNFLDGLDESHIVSGSSSFGDFDYSASDIQNSFSSEWSRRGLVHKDQTCHTDSSWWSAIGTTKKKKTKGKGLRFRLSWMKRR